MQLHLADATNLCELAERYKSPTYWISFKHSFRCEKEFTKSGRKEYQSGIEAIQGNSVTISQKAVEYRQKIDQSVSTLCKYPVLQDVGSFGEEWGKLKGLRRELNNIQAELEPFNELPPDPVLAKVELEQARANLRQLLVKRDALLTELLKSESK